MTPRERQNAAAPLRRAACAALLTSALALAGCSGLTSSVEETPVSVLDRDYKEIVAKYLKTTFKDRTGYDSFEISEPRWVHTGNGWVWLTCVGFQDRGRRRSYAVFLNAGKIIDSRYAVETDSCETQAYAPFAQMTGGLEPLY